MATGFQIAFFTLAINFISIPLGKMAADALDLESAQQILARLMIFALGAVAIFAFPGARRMALAYVAKPIRADRRRELFAVIALDVLVVSAGIAGAIALWAWAMHGSQALATTTSPARLLAAAWSPAGLVLVVLGTVIAPILEEIVFRGFMFDAFRRRWSVATSAILSSAVFAVYHPFFAVALAQSLVFFAVMWRTGSMRGPILLHACTNLSLWYPLMGQFVFPHNPEGSIAGWMPHFAAFSLSIIGAPAYLWLALRTRADSAVAENRF
jgi:membrane protease YdiL (CAAX protease family)